MLKMVEAAGEATFKADFEKFMDQAYEELLEKRERRRSGELDGELDIGGEEEDARSNSNSNYSSSRDRDRDRVLTAELEEVLEEADALGMLREGAHEMGDVEDVLAREKKPEVEVDDTYEYSDADAADLQDADNLPAIEVLPDGTTVDRRKTGRLYKDDKKL